MPSPWVLVTVLLVHLVRCNENSIDPAPEAYEPKWVYLCMPRELGCTRVERLQAEKNRTTIYQSLAVCRSVCGRFGGIWPRPVTAALGDRTMQFHPKFLRFDLMDIPAEPHVRRLLIQMTRVVTENLMAECLHNVTEVPETPVIVRITIRRDNPQLTWDTDESYTLDVQYKDNQIQVHIVGETVFGARHGLETFVQLVAPEVLDNPDPNQWQCSLNILVGARIRDRPTFPYRGLLLDTSRNFIPMENIKKTIDGMAATKMNVFHWHVTDTHSFPLESYRVPELTRYGAYSAYEIYSTDEVRELVEYALVRGVRVVIEIDSPAHAGNGWQWGEEKGLGDLAVCVNALNWRNLCIQPPCGQLNPANPNMYTVLKNLYMDVAEVLPKPALLHVGGDEVFLNCWNSSQEITKYMADNNMPLSQEGFMRLWSEFHEKALAAWDEALSLTKTPPQPVMIWSSELTQPNRIEQYLDKNRYVIEVWSKQFDSPLLSLLQKGYRAVTVPKDVWYLDHGFWGSTKYSNWRRMYQHLLPEDSKMLGGEVGMWSEYVDANGLDARVWPRAAAVAERLWANPKSSADSAEPRLQRLRERLVSRGLRPDVLAPGWCAQHDSACHGLGIRKPKKNKNRNTKAKILKSLKNGKLASKIPETNKDKQMKGISRKFSPHWHYWPLQFGGKRG